jgi:hypothetical protein
VLAVRTCDPANAQHGRPTRLGYYPTLKRNEVLIVAIGDNVILNTGCTVDHHNRIGNHARLDDGGGNESRGARVQGSGGAGVRG